MKSQVEIFVVTVLLATSSLFSLAQNQPSKAGQDEAKSMVQSTTTRQQVKVLIAKAETPADHHKIAAYFMREADRFEEDAKDHEYLATVYRKNPSTSVGGKQSGTGSIFRTTEHCEAVAKSLRDAAKSLRELAAEHEQMAKEAAK